MTEAGDFAGDVAAALRELAVYYSHDRDAARTRDDPTLAEALHARFLDAHQLADRVHDLQPGATDAGSWALAEARALAAELSFRLAGMVPTIAARRASVGRRVPRQRLEPMVDRVVAYLRVSTERQVEGFGLDVQEAAVRLWARRNRARVAFVVRDEGRSGTADVIDRPGLAEALGHIEAGRASAVVVPRLDRLARDLVLQEWIRAELLRMGAQLRSADATEDLYLVDDPDNPTGTLVRQILGAVAQYERAMIRLRMEAGKAKKRQAGGYAGGQPPYGFRASEHDLVPNLEEQRQVARMRRWRREGRSLREIADRLNADGIPARRGRWHPQTVARVLDRAQARRAS